MPGAAAQSPIQDITQAEAIAARRVAEAERKAADEMETAKNREGERLEKEKSSRKERYRQELLAEEKRVGAMQRDGAKETEREIAALRKRVKEKEPTIIDNVIDQFLSPEP